MLGEALLDLTRLLVRVHVQRQRLRCGVAADLLEPVRRTGAHGVGGDADCHAALTQTFDLPEVLRHRLLAEARQATARIGG